VHAPVQKASAPSAEKSIPIVRKRGKGGASAAPPEAKRRCPAKDDDEEDEALVGALATPSNLWGGGTIRHVALRAPEESNWGGGQAFDDASLRCDEAFEIDPFFETPSWTFD
jgi:hypothetical protein